MHVNKGFGEANSIDFIH